MSIDLTGKAAVVTGAGTGIGRGIAVKLAACGARVAVHYNTSAEGAVETVHLIEEAGGHAIALQGNLIHASEGRAMVERAIELFGRLDILVNNAALSTEAFFFDVTEDLWDRTLSVNLKSAYFCAQVAAQQMVEQGGGRIIFIGSIHGALTAPSFSPYAASKGGMNMVTRSLALELAPQKITVNCVAPGLIEVERYYEQFPWYDRDEAAKNVPLGRVGFPEDVAGLVAFLASDEAAFITGQIVFVDGGQGVRLAIHRADLG
ncbi:MAG: glucose 1-dehydrogenase [Deltaproteobacteria bacterium]|nr:glucose 1-dehydrogenase [Deltaproteobacteria bacterium]